MQSPDCEARRKTRNRNSATPKYPIHRLATLDRATQRHNLAKAPLILTPSVAAGHALVETRHGLVGAANLDLEEGGLVAVAPLAGALHAALLRIVPGARAAKDVLSLLALKGAPREDGLGDCVLKGARAALEPVGALYGEGDGENVCAVRADWPRSVDVVGASGRQGPTYREACWAGCSSLGAGRLATCTVPAGKEPGPLCAEACARAPAACGRVLRLRCGGSWAKRRKNSSIKP